MSIATQVDSLAGEVGADVKTLLAKIGNLATLSTTEKTNLVGAINELLGQIASGSGIDDTSTGTGASWSASKVIAELAALKASIEDGAPITLDTFNEIAAAMNDDPDFYATLNAVITTNSNAITTLATNVGDTAVDYRATYIAARDAV